MYDPPDQENTLVSDFNKRKESIKDIIPKTEDEAMTRISKNHRIYTDFSVQLKSGKVITAASIVDLAEKLLCLGIDI